MTVATLLPMVSETQDDVHHDLVAEWLEALAEAHLVRDEKPATRTILEKYAQRARTLFHAAELDRDGARAVGTALVPLCIDKPLALSRSLCLLARHLPASLDEAPTLAQQGHLAALLSEIALGFVEAQAREARLISRTILSAIGHDLNSPLSVISGYTHMLMSEMSGPTTELQRADLKVLQEATEKLRQRMDQALGLAKVRTMTTPLREEPVLLPGLFSELSTAFEEQAAQNGTTLEIVDESGLSLIQSDHERLRDALLPLLDNAIKFTLQGSVRLTVRQEGEGERPWLSFEIADSGTGITPARLQALWPEREQAPGIAGRGLWQSWSHTYLLGGQWEIASELGAGSTATVRVPLRLPA